jgi:uroporphyrinogen-III synthase
MTPALQNRTIALAEGRQLEELAQMLEKEGATALRYPMINILDAPDEKSVLAWLHDLVAGKFDYVILMTGEALRRLLGFADRAGVRQDVIAALSRALKEVGLTPTQVAGTPTTEGVIATLKTEPLRGQNVGLTLYAEPNPALVQFLKEAGATVRTVIPYIYAPASDGDRVAELIDRLSGGKIDAIIFTSSPQVDRLYQVAHKKGLVGELQRGLAQSRIAAVGPVVAEALRQRGAPAHISPDQGFVMKNLVQLIKRQLAS